MKHINKIISDVSRETCKKEKNNVSRETLNNNNYNKLLYKLAKKSFNKGEIPVGTIVIYNNKIIGKGFNTRQKKYNVCGHAEINAILMAEKNIKDWRLNGCILISTLKPCELCQNVIKECRIKDVYYILDNKNTLREIIKIKKYFPGNKFEEDYLQLLQSFFKKLR